MSTLGTLILHDTYRDSVFLMQVSSKLEKCDGVILASAMSGTDRNKDLFRDSDLFNSDVEAALPDDLIIAVRGESQEAVDQALGQAESLLKESAKDEQASEKKMERLEQLLAEDSDVNLVLISVAGDFAKYEALKAVQADLNVMLYSDNVSLDAELEIKRRAHEKGLLVMGPDCGTSIINGVPLAFANEVQAGPIGVVGASGTGIQEVTSLIDQHGGGITHAIGTGGRDPKEEIGGITMMDGLAMLAEDPKTEVILIVSKPPHETVQNKICEFIKACPKPVVVNFAGKASADNINAAGGTYAGSLEEAAYAALKAAGIKDEVPELFAEIDLVKLEEDLKKQSDKHYFRAIFGGGSLCYEAMFIAKEADVKDLFSNTPLTNVQELKDVYHSQGNTFLDMGEDVFTQGKPHPMIDPTQKVKRLVQEMNDPEVGIILTDCVIGYGSHEDPAGLLAEAIQTQARKAIPPVIIASVCGTEADKQSLSRQIEKLKSAGVYVCRSNREAAMLTVRASAQLRK